MEYLWQKKDWHQFSWDSSVLLEKLAQVRKKQGIILGKSEFFSLQDLSIFISREAINTAEIEGEKLDLDSVRSSVARRLGLPTAGLPDVRRETDGLVQVLMDAVSGYTEVLTREKLWSWQAALFPSGYSGIRRIQTGQWRENKDPMQVISGSMGKERVHFQAPPSHVVHTEMEGFLNWWNTCSMEMDGIIRAATAHFYFVTIHPFEDGNGRIARALTDRALAQDEKTGKRVYSLSFQITREKSDYYYLLEKSQKGQGDLTEWLEWFLGMFCRSIEHSEGIIENSLFKSRFYKALSPIVLNPRQLKVLGKMIDSWPEEFKGGMTNKKYVSITKTSPETAKRDIKDLVAKGLLLKNSGGGRSTSYRLIAE